MITNKHRKVYWMIYNRKEWKAHSMNMRQVEIGDEDIGEYLKRTSKNNFTIESIYRSLLDCFFSGCYEFHRIEERKDITDRDTRVC